MKIEKIEKLVANLHDKTEYLIGIKYLKQALNHGLVFKKFDRVIKFNQNAWLQQYVDMNTDLRKKTKNDFGKDFLKFMNTAEFGDIKLEETIWCQKQIIIQQRFSQNIY